MKVDKNEVCMLGIVCVTILEASALISGHDGQFFGVVVAAVSGMVGLAFGIGLGQKIQEKKVSE